MLQPTPGLVLDYLPLPDGARLVRVYGDPPCLILPSALPAPAPGAPALPLTALGDYCFSEKPRGLPAPETLCRCAVQPDGSLRLLRAPGHTLAAPHPRYSFDEPTPAAPLHPICGSFLEEVTLPDTLRVIGSCAFYNCRALRRLSIASPTLSMGSDVLLNVFALSLIEVRAPYTLPTGLFSLINCTTGHIRAVFCPPGSREPQAAVWFPEYWEDIEETPAHILLHTFSGQGYHYRQCFLNNVFLPAEYDRVFPQGHDADDASIMAMLCFDRLRYPTALAGDAAAAYRDFLRGHTLPVVKRLLAAQDLDALRALLALEVMDAAALAEAGAQAARSDRAEAAALLADAELRLRAAARPARKKRYSFDF